MFKRLGIRTKIIIAFVSIAVVAVSLVGLVSYEIGSGTLEAESFNKLTAVREMKAGEIEDHIQEISNQAITLSKNRMIVDAMRAFDEGVHTLDSELEITDADGERIDAELRRYYKEEFLPRLVANVGKEASESDYWPEDEDTRLMQDIYIADNPYSTGSKHFLDSPGDGSSYGQAHELYHPIIRDFLERFGYYDIFLVDVETAGHISYSVFKEVDFGTSLLEGPYAETNIAKAYRAARNSDDPDSVHLADFEAYAPSYGAPAAFVSSPIFDGDEKVGVLVFQMPIDRINSIMTSHDSWSDVGLGESGEAYIVGADFLMRNQSRFLSEDSQNFFKTIEEIGVPLETRARIKSLDSTIGLLEIRTEGAQAALMGETGTAIFPDYREIPVLSAYRPLDIPGMNWVIMSEIDQAEAFGAIRALGLRILGLVAALIVGIVVLAMVFSRTITRPLEQLTATADELATGNLNAEVRFKDQGDEIGVLASSFDSMRVSMKDLVENLEERVADRTTELERATERIRSIVGNASDAIVTIDFDQNIVIFNPAAERIFGYTEAEVVGQPLTILMAEESGAIHPKEVEKFRNVPEMSRGMNVRRAVHGQRKDGSQFPAEASISKMVLDGKVFFTAFLRDITERRRLEMQLEQASERMSRELSFAREIQIGMLPLIYPAFPQRREIDLYATLHSAREVGGDFYDYYFLDDDHLCFIIADVSGKGAPAALLMAVSKTLIKSRAADDPDPASILTHVNNELSQDNASAMFVTAFLGILDVRTGELRYTNAGHNAPYIKRADGTLEIVDAFHGPVVGGLPGMTYGQDDAILGPEDTILLYTDGVTEAMDEAETLYTDERLTLLLQSQALMSSQAMVEGILSDVVAHQGEAEQSDDITILAIRYTGQPEAIAWDRLGLRIRNQYSDLEVAEERFQEFALKNDIPDGVRQPVSIVLDEILNNIVSYAYEDEEEHEIDIHVDLSGNRLVVTIKDDGVPFNPFGRGEPDTSLSVEDREIGGLGIHLVRSMMDEYLYQRHINQNVVTLVKMIVR